MNKPRVALETNFGRVVIELSPDTAPKTTENFLSYVDDKFYDGTVFHRVIPNFMVQGGGFDASLEKKPTRTPVANEADNGVKNARGTVAMARTSDPHSATAQFFVNVVDNGFLDHTEKSSRGWGYTVFGTVTEGLDVVDRIAKTKTGAKGPFDKDAPQESVVIQTARRL